MGARRAARPAEQRPASPAPRGSRGGPQKMAERRGRGWKQRGARPAPPHGRAHGSAPLRSGVPELPEEAGREMGELLPGEEGRRKGRRTPL